MDNVQDDIQEFHTLHPQKKLKALSIIAVIFALSIGAGLYFAGQTKRKSYFGRKPKKVSR
jgi:uncharacterized protein HemX